MFLELSGLAQITLDEPYAVSAVERTPGSHGLVRKTVVLMFPDGKSPACASAHRSPTVLAGLRKGGADKTFALLVDRA